MLFKLEYLRTLVQCSHNSLTLNPRQFLDSSSLVADNATQDCRSSSQPHHIWVSLSSSLLHNDVPLWIYRLISSELHGLGLTTKHGCFFFY